MGAPRWYEVVLGCLAVLIGCVGAAAAFRAGRQGGNWLHHVVAGGAVLFVIGVIGQRSFPTAEESSRLGPAAITAIPGPWDAGVRFPLIGVAITPVALAGLLLASLGVALLLMFVPASEKREAMPRLPPGRLEDEDLV